MQRKTAFAAGVAAWLALAGGFAFLYVAIGAPPAEEQNEPHPGNRPT